MWLFRWLGGDYRVVGVWVSDAGGMSVCMIRGLHWKGP